MQNKLCIDIGGTNIKAAVIKTNILSTELNKINIMKIKTLGWMNKSLPEISSKDHWASFIHKNRNNPEIHSISIDGPFGMDKRNNEIVSEDHYVKTHGVPYNLREIIAKKLGLNVSIMNDADAWIKGIIKYYKLTNKNIDFPIISLCLGTGLAFAGASNEKDVQSIDINKYNNFDNLSKAAGQPINEGYRVHDILGYKFFNWIKNDCLHWDYLRIRKEYTKRLIALLQDLGEKNIYNYKNIKTIFLSGGSSDFLSIRTIQNQTSKKIVGLREDSLDFDLNLIPLLGHI
ncbi:MAG: ROK family protein [Ignavibacteriales bacterium]|nr:ROK family protein [Ignavibacteriales bacterium]